MGADRRRLIGGITMAVGAAALVVGGIGLISDDDPDATTDSATTTTPPTTTTTPPTTTTTPPTTTIPPATLPPTTAPTPTTTTPTTSPPTLAPVATAADRATVDQFIQGVLVAGLTSGDVDELFERLHPEVVALYGAEACRSYLPTVVDPDLVIVVDGVDAPETWNWEADGVTTSIDDAIPVQVSLTAQGQTIMQELHLVDIDGELRWFTDCGDVAGQS